MRPLLSENDIDPRAMTAMKNFHANTVEEVRAATAKHEWVIVGMRTNPVVKNARKYMASKEITYHYLEYGSYLAEWKKRLAIKLWSGWPTFPQVFHKGKLIGGAADLRKYLP